MGTILVRLGSASGATTGVQANCLAGRSAEAPVCFRVDTSATIFPLGGCYGCTDRAGPGRESRGTARED